MQNGKPGQEKRCAECHSAFSVLPTDRAFYSRMQVPDPTCCYFCRMIRRLSCRNERFLYHRKCDSTGKQIISAFAIDAPFPVYDIDAWWSDSWNALQFGVAYDPQRPFFEQFFELRNRVPRLSLQQQRPMENSAYCNCASRNKNCYLVFSTNRCEDCYYGSWVNDSRDCLDNLNIEGCELCYECVNCRDCYNTRYSQDCDSCIDSYFLRDCIGCQHCFGCTSLVRQQYCIFNKAVGKDKYLQFLSDCQFGSRKAVDAMQLRIAIALGVPVVKAFHGVNVEHCSGEYLRNCKSAHTCFECDDGENISYCMCVQAVRHCMDFSYWGGNAELMYECQACGYDVYSLRFCNLCWSNCRFLTYCDHCFSSSNCFGCVGLRNNEYCILNRQYSKEEYDAVVPKIIASMQNSGEWGEFFPTSQSAFCYNETLAQEHLPLTREEARERGWRWRDIEAERKASYIGSHYETPDTIVQVDDSICEKVLQCHDTGRPFKIIAPELAYYRRMNIPIPNLCPDARHVRRLMLKNPRSLWARTCMGCGQSQDSPYSPTRPEQILCEHCYEQRFLK